MAPAKFIEEAIHRDLYIHLYDMTRLFDMQVKRYGGDLVDVLDRLIERRHIDLFDEAAGDRKLLSVLSKYFFRLEEIGLVKVEEGFVVKAASEEALNLLRIFVTAYVLPRGLDVLGGKVVSESTMLATLKKLRETLLDTIPLESIAAR